MLSPRFDPLPLPEGRLFGGVLGYLGKGGLWGIWLGLGPLMLFLAAPPRQPIWLYGQVDTRLESADAKIVSILAVVLGLIPAAVSIFTNRMRPAQALPFALLAMMVLSVITASLFAAQQGGDIVKPLLGLFIFMLAIVLVSVEDIDEAFVRNLLIGYAVVHAASAVIAVADGNFLYGRLMGRLGPNFWGSICAYGLLAATATRHRGLFLTLLAIDVVTLVLAQNRTGMLAAMIGGGVLIVLAHRRADFSDRLWMWLALLMGGIVLLFAFPTLLNQVFMVDDPRRGLDSGGTGRVVAWQEAMDVFRENPLLGVGYRHHEQFITAASSAHQAYLATAADMGIIGLLAYLAFLAAGIGCGLYKAITYRSKAYAALTAIIIGYAVHGFAEQRAINFANSVSLMVIVAVALTTRIQLAAVRRPIDRMFGRA